MNNAPNRMEADYGAAVRKLEYSHAWEDARPQPGVEFTRNSACGEYKSKVLRRHRYVGYWETVVLEGGHPALLGSIQVLSDHDIRLAIVGPLESFP